MSAATSHFLRTPGPQLRRIFPECLVVGLVLTAVALENPALAQTPDPFFNASVDQQVNALAVQPDGKIVVGGQLTVLNGSGRSFLGRLNPDGSLDQGFNPGANGYIYALAVQSDGKILVGGGFTTLGGTNRSHIGRLNVDGTLDNSFDPGADGDVQTIAIQPDGKILAGGWFGTLGGQARSNIGRLNTNGTPDLAFNPGAGGGVYALAVQPDGKILAGGGFFSLATNGCSFLGRINQDGSPDTNFVAGANNYTYGFVLQPDGKIIAGGHFTQMNGLARNHLARLNSDGTIDPGFNPDAGTTPWIADIYALALQTDGKLLVGGIYNNLAGQNCNYLGRLNADGSFDGTFVTSLGTTANALALQKDGRILAGGWGMMLRLTNTSAATESLTTFTPTNTTYLTWLRGGSTPEVWRTTFEVSTNGTSWTSPTAGARISGGWQGIVSGIATNARVRARGYVSTGWDNASGMFVETYAGPIQLVSQPAGLTNSAGTAATFFITAGGTPPLSYFWRKNGTVLADAGNVTGSRSASLTLSNVLHADAASYSVVVSNSFGAVTSSVESLTVIEPILNSQPQNQFVDAGQTAQFSVTAVGTSLTYQWRRNGGTFSGATNASLSLTNVQGTDSGNAFQVVVTSPFGAVTSSIATLTVNTALADPLSPGPNYPVRSVAVQPDGKLIISGNFSWVNGQVQSGIARLNADGSLDTDFLGGLVGIPSSAALPLVAMQEDGKIVIAGDISYLNGQPRNQIGRLNADGSLDTAFNPGVDSDIFAMAIQADGKIVLGGGFTNLAGQACRGFGRLNPDGTLDGSFNPGVTGTVYSIVIQSNGLLLVGGSFTNLAGQTCTNLGRLNSNGTLDASFNAGADGAVKALAILANGSILVGGTFATLGGLARTNLARLNSAGMLDPAFTPNPDGPVNCFAVQTDARILVGGGFGQLAGQPRANLGRLNSDGGVDMTFNPGTDGAVLCLAVQPDGKLIVGGGFSLLDGQPRGNLGRLLATGTAIQTLTGNGTNISWQRSGTGPEFSRVSFDVSTNGPDLARLNGVRIAGGWQVAGLNLPTNAAIRARGFAIGSSDDSSWFVDQFTGRSFVSSQPASRTNDAGTTASFSVVANSPLPMTFSWLKNGAKLTDGGNVTGASTTSLTLNNVFGADAGGYSVIVSNSSGIVTSSVATLTVRDPVINQPPTNQFLTIGQNAQFTVAATGTAPLGYQWLKEGVSLTGATAATLSLINVQAVGAGNYQVSVSNSFGVVTSTVASLSLNLASTDAFNPVPGSVVYAFALQPDGKVLAGGNFTTLGGQPRNHVGRLNPDGSLDPDFNPNVNGVVNAITVQADGKILVGGSFTVVSGLGRTDLARLNVDGSLDTNYLAGINGAIYALALQTDGKLLAGGTFTTIGGQSHPYLGRLNSDGSPDTAFTASADNWVQSIAIQAADGKIIAGGGFHSLAGQSRSYLGRLGADGSMDAGFNPGANNPVQCLTLQPDGRILIGGSFSILGGQPRAQLGRLNSDGSLDPDFTNGTDNVVYSIALQTDGRVILGGGFSTVAAQTRRAIARLNADGSVDGTFFPALDGDVYGVALQSDGKLLLSGSFATINGQPRSFFGRLNASGAATQSLTYDGSSLTWMRGGTGPEVWRAGFEVLSNGVWNSLGFGIPIAGGWQLSGVSYPLNTSFRARGFVSGGYLNGSGWFVGAASGPATILGQPISRTNNAATPASFYVDASGSALGYQWRRNGLNLVDGGNVTGAGAALLLLSSVYGADAGNYTVVVSNGFGSVTSLVATLTVVDPLITNQPVSQNAYTGQVAQLSVAAVGSAPLSYFWTKNGLAVPGVSGSALSFTNVQTTDAGIYQAIVSNQFSSVTSAPAFFSVNAAFADSLDLAPGSPVFGFAPQTDGRLVLAGRFSSIAGQPRSYLARINADGSLDPGLNPGAGYDAYCLGLQSDGRIIVGGAFGSLGGQTRPAIGRLNADGSLDAGFNPNSSSGGNVYALAVQPDDKIVVGGWFTSMGGSTRYNIARLNANGTLDGTFNSGAGDMYSFVYSLAMQGDGKVVIGGRFASAGGQARANIARLNTDGTVDLAFNPGANGDIYCVAVQGDGKILMGGNFTVAGGGARTNFARLNPDGTLDTAFNPGINGAIYSLTVQTDGRVLLGGTFTMVGGMVRGRIARLNPDGSPDLSFDPEADSYVHALTVQPDGKILAGGYFLNLGAQTRNSFARLANPTLATQSFSYGGASLTWLRGGASPEVAQVVFSASTNGAGWFSLGAGTRIAGGWQLNSVSLPSNASIRARGWAAGGYQSGSSWFADAYLGPPVIVNQPVGRTNNIATTAILSVMVEGTPALSYRWRRNGLDLADGGNLTGSGTPSLVLTNVLPANSGAYSVVVTNNFGAVTSLVANLVVADPRITSQPLSRTNNAGTTATFSVVGDGTLTLGYQWLKDGLVLSDVGNVSGSTTNTLTVTNVFHADAAGYSVVVTNQFGAITSAVAVLTVVDPFISTQPASQTVNVGSNAIFSVGVIGTAAIGYQWFRNGTLLAGETNSSSTLTNAQAADAGSFWQVVVTNAFGVATSAVAVLTVNLSFDDAFNPGPNSQVYALAVQPDGQILVGGNFGTIAGQARARIARLNPDGSLDGSFNPGPGANNIVYALAVQPDGKLVAGGQFTSLGGQSRYGLARLNPDGSVDNAFNPGLEGSAYTLALEPDGNLLVGGERGTIAVRANIGRGTLDRFAPDGSLDVAFNPVPSGPVYAMALQPDGKILVGGLFTSIAGVARTNLARLNHDGSLDSSFAGLSSNTVNALVLQADGRILVGGQVLSQSPSAGRSLFRLNADGTSDPTFNPQIISTISSLALQADGRIIVGGTFTLANGLPRNRIARFNPDASLDTTFDPGTSSTVYALQLQADGSLLVGGVFGAAGGLPRLNLARMLNTTNATQSLAFNSSSATWLRGGAAPEVWRTTFDGTTNGSDWLSMGSGVRVAGGWQWTGSAPVSNLAIRARGNFTGGRYNGSAMFVEASGGPAALNRQPASVITYTGSNAWFVVQAAGTPPLRFQWQKDGLLLSDGGSIFGSASSVLLVSNAVAANAGGYQVVVTNNFGAVTSLVAQLTILDLVISNQPTSLAVSNGQPAQFSVVAGGGSSLNYQWLKNGSVMPGQNNSVLSFAAAQATDAANYQVVVSDVSGAVTSAVAVLTVNLAIADSFAPSATASVYALAPLRDGKVLIGGAFATVSGQPRNRIARLNPDGSLDAGYNAGVGNNNVQCFAIQPDDRVLVGGLFPSLSGTNCQNLGRLKPDGTFDATFSNSTPNTTVSCLLPQPDGRILVGGSFTTLAGQTRNHFGRLNADGSLDLLFNPATNGSVNSVNTMALQPDGKILIGGAFAELNGVSRANIARLNPDGSVDTSFDAAPGDMVYAIEVQPDGKILVAGTKLGLIGRDGIARLLPDGRVDRTFNGGAPLGITSLCLQTDGGMIIGGSFTQAGGLARSYLARLNSDGSPDLNFNPGANAAVNALALQSDGSLLVGGTFTTLAGQSRTRLGRITNPSAVTQTLGFDRSSATWLRGGAGPEIWRATFDTSTDGVNWSPLAVPGRISGGWQLTGLSLPHNAIVRARGYISCGQYEGTSVFLESVYPALTPPLILVNDGGFGLRSNHFGFNLQASVGQVVVIEASTNFVTWVPVQTNLVTGGGLVVFMDADQAKYPNRFYRARLDHRLLPPPGAVGGTGFSGGKFGFNVSGVPGQTVVVEASTNLSTWTPLTTNTLNPGPFYFNDLTSTNFAKRFYRGRWQ